MLQLLTIVYSQWSYDWASTLSMHSERKASPLCTGVTTLTRGLSATQLPVSAVFR